MGKSIYLYILFAANPFISYTQTCIIAKKTKDAIFIGADSRIVSSSRINGVYKKDTSSMCKIFTQGKYNFAISGSGINQSPKYVSDACKKGGSFVQVIQNYTNTFNEWIKNDINRLKVALPTDSFYSLYKSWQPYYNNVIFWGIEKDTLFLGMAYFTATLEPLNNNNIRIEGWISQETMFAIGHTNHIEKSLKKETWKGDVSTIIQSLIKIEAKANPIEVGGQIHLLKFTKKSGLEWINRKKPPCL